MMIKRRFPYVFFLALFAAAIPLAGTAAAETAGMHNPPPGVRIRPVIPKVQQKSGKPSTTAAAQDKQKSPPAQGAASVSKYNANSPETSQVPLIEQSTRIYVRGVLGAREEYLPQLNSLFSTSGLTYAGTTKFLVLRQLNYPSSTWSLGQGEERGFTVDEQGRPSFKIYCLDLFGLIEKAAKEFEQKGADKPTARILAEWKVTDLIADIKAKPLSKIEYIVVPRAAPINEEGKLIFSGAEARRFASTPERELIQALKFYHEKKYKFGKEHISKLKTQIQMTTTVTFSEELLSLCGN